MTKKEKGSLTDGIRTRILGSVVSCEIKSTCYDCGKEKKMLFHSTLAVLILVSLSACKADEVYTLYRSSPTDPNMRIHVATFNASEGNDYNSENCYVAKNLFANQPRVTVRYWCEKGSYKK